MADVSESDEMSEDEGGEASRMGSRFAEAPEPELSEEEEVVRPRSKNPAKQLRPRNKNPSRDRPGLRKVTEPNRPPSPSLPSAEKTKKGAAKRRPADRDIEDPELDEGGGGEEPRRSVLCLVTVPAAIVGSGLKWVICAGYGITIGAIITAIQHYRANASLRDMQSKLENAREKLKANTARMMSLKRQNMAMAVREYNNGNVEFAVMYFRDGKLASNQLRQQNTLMARLNQIEIAIAATGALTDLSQQMTWVNVGSFSQGLNGAIDSTDASLFGIDQVIEQLREVPSAAATEDSGLLEELKALIDKQKKGEMTLDDVGTTTVQDAPSTSAAANVAILMPTVPNTEPGAIPVPPSQSTVAPVAKQVATESGDERK
jgi:hypothetical protein